MGYCSQVFCIIGFHGGNEKGHYMIQVSKFDLNEAEASLIAFAYEKGLIDVSELRAFLGLGKTTPDITCAGRTATEMNQHAR